MYIDGKDPQSLCSIFMTSIFMATRVLESNPFMTYSLFEASLHEDSFHGLHCLKRLDLSVETRLL